MFTKLSVNSLSIVIPITETNLLASGMLELTKATITKVQVKCPSKILWSETMAANGMELFNNG